MIDIRKLKELVRLMVENDLTELDLQDQQETVTVKRGGAAGPGGAVGGMPVVYHSPAPHAPHAPHAVAAGAAAGAAGASSSASEAPAADATGGDDAGLVAITSPMVGTVYLAANPESPAFVSVGAAVGADTTVCLIEAMKVFNEIKAETSGTVERILVENGKPVEYGQKIMLVRPA